MRAMTLLATSLSELNHAQKGYLQAQSYYSGTVAEKFPAPWLETLLKDTGKAFRLNFAATPVDAITERLSIDSFAGVQAEVNAFQLIWEENEMPLEAPMVHAHAGRYGDSYVIAWPDEEMATGVAMYRHSPINVRLFYDPESPRRKSHAVHRWVAVAPPVLAQDEDEKQLIPGRTYVHAVMYFADHIEHWVSSEPVDLGVGQEQRVNYTASDISWVAFAEDVDNPFGFVPVYHFRNDRPYGVPEHYEAYGPQDMITKTLSNLMNSLDHSGYPQRYALSEAGRKQEFGAPVEPEPTGSTVQATNPQGFKAGPGETWLVEGATSVGQFAAASSNNFIDPINALVKWMGSVTDTPVHLFDLGGNAPSGESIDASTAPLDKKVEHRQLSYGYTWRELARDVLEMAGLAVTGPIQVVWSPNKRATTKEDWDVVAAKITAGVPQREALIQAGYLPAVVDAWLTPGVEAVVAGGLGDGAAGEIEGGGGLAGTDPGTASAATAVQTPVQSA